MTLDHDTLNILAEALEKLDDGFSDLPDFTPQIDREALRAVLLEVAERMQDNYPYQHPFYAGQMLKPPHPVARLAYALAQYVNPNNHALDGGKASSHMEKEAVAQIAALFGWAQHLGHLTGGGTLANLEALWAARELHPGKKVVASEQAHYTHSRISEVIGLGFEAITVDDRARMDMDALEMVLQTGDVGTVVVTMGTTATGSVDPLPQVIALQAKYGFRIHADAAYGGYFTLAENLDAEARAAFDCLDQVDSLAIDPHKHGLQPYGCGCILFRDPAVGKLYAHNSPYTYFTSAELHLGEISLECSRAGASAVALWATMRLLPLEHRWRIRRRPEQVSSSGAGTVRQAGRLATLHHAVRAAVGHRGLRADRNARQRNLAAVAGNVRRGGAGKSASGAGQFPAKLVGRNVVAN